MAAGKMGGMPTDPPQTASALNVVLVEPEIAGNVGAVGRSCVAGGATLWLVRPLGFLLDDRRIRRAGLDYWEHLELRVVDGWAEVEAALRPGRLWRFNRRGDGHSAVATDAGLAATGHGAGISSDCPHC